MAWAVVSLLSPENKRKGKMNRREKMRNTNSLCRKWLLDNFYNYVWLKPHNKHPETYETKDGVFYSTDIYNLFDGICIDRTGNPIFLQLSTTNYHSEKPYQKFLQDNGGFKIMLMRAKKQNGRWKVESKILSKT